MLWIEAFLLQKLGMLRTDRNILKTIYTRIITGVARVALEGVTDRYPLVLPAEHPDPEMTPAPADQHLTDPNEGVQVPFRSTASSVSEHEFFLQQVPAVDLSKLLSRRERIRYVRQFSGGTHGRIPGAGKDKMSCGMAI